MVLQLASYDWSVEWQYNYSITNVNKQDYMHTPPKDSNTVKIKRN